MKKETEELKSKLSKLEREKNNIESKYKAELRNNMTLINANVKLQNENKYLKIDIERLNNIINEINSIVEYWGYDEEQNDISCFRRAMKNIKDILGSDKE